MKQRLNFRLFALLLVVALLIPYMGIRANAENLDLPETETEEEVIDSEIDMDDPIVEEGFADYIDVEDFQEKGLTHRLVEREELNTLVFGDDEGRITVYYFDDNIKFINEQGQTVTKDLHLVKRASRFAPNRTDVDISMPVNLSQGVDFSYYGFDLRITPLDAEAVTGSTVDDAVVYEGAFGTGTKLRYTPMLSGVKEDIILENYRADASFSFLLETDGLVLHSDENGAYLSGVGKDEPLFYLGQTIVYDAIGKPANGTFTYEEVEGGYRITIGAEDSFLADPTTIYPVTIDPSITISDNATGNNSIEDVPVYQGYPTTNFGSYQYDRAGYAGADYKIGRTVVRLKGLLQDSTFLSLAANDIVSAKFYIADASGTSGVKVNLYPLMTNTTWTESNLTWNTVGTIAATATASAAPTANSYGEFDITSLVQQWRSGYRNGNCGFILKGANESSTDKALYSAEHSTTGKRPYFVIQYEVSDGSFYINNKGSGKYLQNNSGTPAGKSGLISSLGSTIRWKIVNVNGGVAFRSVSNETKCLGVSTSGNSVVLVNAPVDNIPANCVWSLLGTTGGYRIKSNYNNMYLRYSGSSLSVTAYNLSEASKFVWRTCEVGAMRELANINLADKFVLNINESCYIAPNSVSGNTIWASQEDFQISMVDTSVASINDELRMTGRSIGITTLTVKHKVTDRAFTATVYVDRYTYELSRTFGFTDHEILLILSVYDSVDSVYTTSPSIERAWIVSRILGDIVYSEDELEIIFNQVCGVSPSHTGDSYYTGTLHMTQAQCDELKNTVSRQYKAAYKNGKADFSHLQIALSALLAKDLNKSSQVVSIATLAVEDVPHFAGWLGDAVLFESIRPPVMGDDDYCADLDAVNIYYLTIQSQSYRQAICDYYSLTSSGQRNRATIFLSHISYNTVRQKVFVYLVEIPLCMLLGDAQIKGDTDAMNKYVSLIANEEYYWSVIRTQYPNTYDFLYSLQNELDHLGDF